MTRQSAYIAVNLGFAGLVLVGSLVGADSGVHPLYLLLLFALCSGPLLCLTALNGRHALLAVFAAMYFVLYGALDLWHLFSGTAAPASESGQILAGYEVLILVGGLLAQLGYHIGCQSGNAAAGTIRDWPERTLVWGGAALWAISTGLVWKFDVNIIANTTIEAQQQGLGGLSGLQVVAFMFASYLQPLSIVILAYAHCRYRRLYMLALLAVALIVSMIFGFVADIKGQVLIGWVLVALTKFLIDGRIPKARIVLVAALIAAIFPVLQANRMLRGDLTHAQAAQNLLQTVQKAVAAAGKSTSGTDRADTFLERMSLKGNVEMIVARTGHDVKYQDGYTLVPLLTVLIPRLIWPTKPDVEAGRVLNQEFGLSLQEDTYISPSHLGELYWNFGWPGVVLGMPLIGLLLGFVGKRCDLSAAATLTRILVLITTIQLLVLGFESSIATQYSVWIRSMLAIGILHWALARSAASAVQPLESPIDSLSPPATAMTVGSRPFPHLMR